MELCLDFHRTKREKSGGQKQAKCAPPPSVLDFAQFRAAKRKKGGPGRSRSFSTVREFFAAKLRKTAKRHADAFASGRL